MSFTEDNTAQIPALQMLMKFYLTNINRESKSFQIITQNDWNTIKRNTERPSKPWFSIIEDEFYRERFSKQVYLSDWVAHYKFFFQYQSDWVVKELNLKFFKDKIPSSFKLILLIFIVFCITFIAYNYHSFFINSLENLFKKWVSPKTIPHKYPRCKCWWNFI